MIMHFYFQCTWMTMNNISTSGGLTEDHINIKAKMLRKMLPTKFSLPLRKQNNHSPTSNSFSKINPPTSEKCGGEDTMFIKAGTSTNKLLNISEDLSLSLKKYCVNSFISFA